MLQSAVSAQVLCRGELEGCTHDPELPIVPMIAIMTPRLTSPPAFPAVHASVHSEAGVRPQDAMSVPTYPTMGFVVVSRMT